MTGIAQVLFPQQAQRLAVEVDGKVVGSSLIGQNFTRPEYFHPRPSHAGAGYDAALSSGSNFGPTNQKLIDRVKASVEQYRKENPDYTGPIPADAVTASASGLDPHISPANADIQAARVARARGLDADAVRHLVAEHTEGPWLGFIGEPRVNVLEVNLALDRRFARPIKSGDHRRSMPLTLRTKLLATYVVFVAALGVMAAWSAWRLEEVGAVSGTDSLGKLRVGRRRAEHERSLERQDSATLFAQLGDPARAERQLEDHRRRFDAAFARAEGNITEPGESSHRHHQARP